MLRPKSPCIGVCSTGIGDSVCRGCKRFSHEVIDWNAYSVDEQWASLQRISNLLEQVASPIVEIFDSTRLREALLFQNIRFDENAGQYLWLLELLKMGAGQIVSLEEFGCRLMSPYKSLSMVELKSRIDDDFYVLSLAHYERYFLR